MSKVRVYEVAKDLGVKPQELVGKIASMGIQVRNHMSVLEPNDAERVRRSLARGQDDKVEERIRPTVVRRRSVARKTPPKPVGLPPAAAPTVVSRVSDDQPESVSPPSAADSPFPGQGSGGSQVPVAAVADKSQEVEASVALVPPSAPEPAAASVAGDAAEPSPADSGMTGGAPAEPVAAVAGAQEAVGNVAASGGVPAEAVVEVSAPARGPRSAQRIEDDPSGASQPPPASKRLSHSNLPPGVIARGSTVAPGAPQLSSEAKSRIVAQHSAPVPGGARPGGPPPRRRELGRAALGPAGRPQQRQGRPGRARKMAPGKKGASTQITVPSAQKRLIRIEGNIGLQQLAQRMSLKATDVLMKLMQLGMTGVNINSSLDTDTAKILASEFGYEIENVAVSTDDLVAAARGEFEDSNESRSGRPPIVTVMGHVDHGKTSLLDKIRSTRVAAREAGGITQHIGAYRVDTKKGPIVFLDTPGHEAFTAMRARGAESTDIVILVAAADDGVMPQTKEAIAHAKAAKVPIVVAVNKIDKEDARPEVVMRDLASEGLQPEDWGGDTLLQNVSAITGEGIDSLLEKVVLQSEMLELKANPAIPGEGVVLEAYLDKGRGPVANVLVRDGSMKTGDVVVAGTAWGKVRSMTDDRGKHAKQVEPATPVEILGLSEVPSAGESFHVVTDSRKAQEIADLRKKQDGASAQVANKRVGLDQIHQMMQSGDVQELKVIIKADVQGSIEAIVKALTELSTDQVTVNVIHTGVGGITENDVLLATASNCIVVGFNVRPAGKAAEVAKSERVDIRLYRVIYEAVDEIKTAMAGLLAPTLVERTIGHAEVRKIFPIPKFGTVAGCFVNDGKVLRNCKARVVRDSVSVWEGQVRGLRRLKDDVREVASGYECGISLEGFNDVKEHDIIECFEMDQVAATI